MGTLKDYREDAANYYIRDFSECLGDFYRNHLDNVIHYRVDATSTFEKNSHLFNGVDFEVSANVKLPLNSNKVKVDVFFDFFRDDDNLNVAVSDEFVYTFDTSVSNYAAFNEIEDDLVDYLKHRTKELAKTLKSV